MCGWLVLWKTVEGSHVWRSPQVNGYICSQRSEGFQGIVNEGSFIHSTGEASSFCFRHKRGGKFGDSTIPVGADPVVGLAACRILMGPD